jgi:hypothetical protein
MNLIASFLLATLLSATALATVSSSTLANDRIEVAPGMYGISHTENFEYVCDVEEGDAGKSAKIKIFLDVDFVGGTGYRFAAGFVGGGSLAGMVAAEAEVVSFKKARCPGLCLSLTIKSNDDGSLNSVDFQEDPITKVISIATSDPGKSTVVGTCVKNEVE